MWCLMLFECFLIGKFFDVGMVMWFELKGLLLLIEECGVDVVVVVK